MANVRRSMRPLSPPGLAEEQPIIAAEAGSALGPMPAASARERCSILCEYLGKPSCGVRDHPGFSYPCSGQRRRGSCSRPPLLSFPPIHVGRCGNEPGRRVAAWHRVMCNKQLCTCLTPAAIRRRREVHAPLRNEFVIILCAVAARGIWALSHRTKEGARTTQTRCF